MFEKTFLPCDIIALIFDFGCESWSQLRKLYESDDKVLKSCSLHILQERLKSVPECYFYSPADGKELILQYGKNVVSEVFGLPVLTKKTNALLSLTPVLPLESSFLLESSEFGVELDNCYMQFTFVKPLQSFTIFVDVQASIYDTTVDGLSKSLDMERASYFYEEFFGNEERLNTHRRFLVKVCDGQYSCLRCNGVEIGTSDSRTSIPLRGITIGSGVDTYDCMSGFVFNVLVFPTRLTVEDIIDVEERFFHNYRTNSPYKNQLLSYNAYRPNFCYNKC